MRAAFVTVTGFVVLLAGGASLLAGEEQSKAPTIDDLEWLAGDWTSEDGAFDEHWLPPKGDAMFAVSRLVVGDKTKFTEMSAIEQTADGLAFRIRHFGPALDPWKMDAAGPMSLKVATLKSGEVVFEDEKRDFPRRIVYARDGDKLTARLEGTKGGKPMVEAFAFKRSGAK